MKEAEEKRDKEPGGRISLREEDGRSGTEPPSEQE